MRNPISPRFWQPTTSHLRIVVSHGPTCRVVWTGGWKMVAASVLISAVVKSTSLERAYVRRER